MKHASKMAAGSLIAASVLAIAGSASASVPAANHDSEFHAALRGSSAYSHVWGHSDYHRSGSRREVEVTLNNAPARIRRHNVVVYVNFRRVGTMYVTRYGHAERGWRTSHGQYVPWAGAGSPVRVRTTGGALVESGRYHADSGHD